MEIEGQQQDEPNQDSSRTFHTRSRFLKDKPTLLQLRASIKAGDELPKQLSEEFT
eukprot:CAMPEP_0113535482 /NCGR_PEP_ID=MMETSP0015_2-20120614/5736_1 /TAXON_ID=2838 /ORGANISM="Odontella" /LENGTH=54 /DNA_ID=CAMNT_0000434753 /DNA_START=532 /DNA_END=696 /DNA_ORIENTATION=- /assembly_acc=CAM_ASM_000160